MRLPRLRLRFPRPSFDWLGGVLNRTVMLYTAFTGALFVIFLIINFPHDVVVRRVLSQIDLSPVELDFNSARFAWYRGYELQGIRLSEAGAPDNTPPLLECTWLDVRPDLVGLLRGGLSGMSWDGELYGGSASGDWTVTPKGGGSGQVQFSNLQLGRYRILTAELDEGQLNGQVSGNFTVQLGANRSSSQVAGQVTVKRPALTGAKIKGFTVPDLQFAQINGKLSLKGDRLELQEVQASGDQLNVQLSGQIVLREPRETSTLNLRATVQPSAATPDALKTLIALIPRRPNAPPDAPVLITGTFASPQFR